jgi:hypothetical protein
MLISGVEVFSSKSTAISNEVSPSNLMFFSAFVRELVMLNFFR